MNAREHRRQPGPLLAALLVAAASLAGCQNSPQHGPIRTAEFVDLARFMGDWYVLGNIPTFIEKDAFNAVESYALAKNGTIDTTFSFRKGGFDGKRKTYHPTGFIRDHQSNAVWDMQFIWPLKAEYRVLFVDPAYQQTIIGRSQRDYVWIMARTPSIPDEQYAKLVAMAVAEGYDATTIRRVPQRWEGPASSNAE